MLVVEGGKRREKPNISVQNQSVGFLTVYTGVEPSPYKKEALTTTNVVINLFVLQ